MNKIKVATVFSGIGSVEFALRRLNIDHEVVFACDNGNVNIELDYDLHKKNIENLNSKQDKRDYVDSLYSSTTRKTNFVKQTYMKNYKIKDEMFFNDIRLLDGKDFEGEIDLFVGGSPCQSFSSVGFKGGLEDTRGTLFYEYARLINEIQPKVFVYENVRGLLNHDKGNTWKIIKQVFESIGYNFTFDILNSSDYGIPQTRRRLFIVGYKKNVIFNLREMKQELKFTMQDFTIENCNIGNFKRTKKGTIKIINNPGIVDNKYFLSKAVKKYVLKGGTKTFYQKPETDLKVGRTILSTMGNCHRAGVDNYLTVNGELRMLTEREALRLMGFTDDFKIVVSKAQMYKQAGNSIVVDVMMHILNLTFQYNLMED